MVTVLPYFTGRTLMGSVGSPFIVLPWQTLCASTSDNSSSLLPSAVPTAAQRIVGNRVQKKENMNNETSHNCRKLAVTD